MSDVSKSILEDIEEYERLCRKYKEQAEYDSMGINPYGKHAKKLKNREIEEEENK
jgi:hypothetical protein